MPTPPAMGQCTKARIFPNVDRLPQAIPPGCKSGCAMLSCAAVAQFLVKQAGTTIDQTAPAKCSLSQGKALHRAEKPVHFIYTINSNTKQHDDGSEHVRETTTA